jgi:ferredoxin/flavodoxin
MKTAIYYFSATGNSLVVARDLAKGLNNAELIPINQALKNPDASIYAVIGFVYPVYMFGLPLIVADFLKAVEINPAAYVFSVATLGGLKGRAHSLAREILKKRGINLACGFSVIMPGNYTPLYGAFSRPRQEKMFARQKIKTHEIADYVSCQKHGRVEEKPFLLNLLLYKMLYKGGSRRIPLSAKGFWITAACTQCGLCAKICPVQNIQMQDGQPYWLTHCQHCMGCLQWCPVEAIQYRKLTIGKKRYRHPDVGVLDIMVCK